MGQSQGILGVLLELQGKRTHRILWVEERLVAILHLRGDTLYENWTSPRGAMLTSGSAKTGPPDIWACLKLNLKPDYFRDFSDM